MTVKDLNDLLVPMLSAPDSQLDAAGVQMVKNIMEIDDPYLKAKELLYLLDSCVCWSWSSDFVVVVLQELGGAFCDANGIDRRKLREEENRVEQELNGIGAK